MVADAHTDPAPSLELGTVGRDGVLQMTIAGKSENGRKQTVNLTASAIWSRWGCGDLLREWTSPEAIFQILKRLSEGRPCDISGIEGYAMLQERGGIQWPFPRGAAPPAQERRLFEDGRFYHEDGRAKFIFEDVAEPPEKPDVEYPRILLTGRGSVTQWHTLTRTDRAPLLKRASPDPAYVEMSKQDAEESGIADGASVVVHSRRGEARVTAKVVEGIRPGQVFMSMHFPGTNDLTLASFDPYSRQPSFKHAAVAIESDGAMLRPLPAVESQSNGRTGPQE